MSQSINLYNQLAKNKLFSKSVNFDLKRIKLILQKLNHPEKKLKNVINVVGTNAKASMSFSLKSILNKAGFKCNLYSSPHLQSFTERFIFDDKDNINVNKADKGTATDKNSIILFLDI